MRQMTGDSQKARHRALAGKHDDSGRGPLTPICRGSIWGFVRGFVFKKDGWFMTSLRQVSSSGFLVLLTVACSGSPSPGQSETSIGGAASKGGGTSSGGAMQTSATSATGGGETGGVPPSVGGAATGGAVGSGCTGAFETVQSSTGLCVARMTTIAAPSGYSDYSIDVTEVTMGQYDAWLATNPALPASTDANCGYVASYAEQASGGTLYTGTDAAHHPVADVDWCDAYAYCKGVGKRLCGAIGGARTPILATPTRR